MRKKTKTEIETALERADLGKRVRVAPAIYASDQSGRMRWMVELRCTACDRTTNTFVENILSGKSTDCKCQTRLVLGDDNAALYSDVRARRLAKRYDAMVQRCTNSSDRNYPNYGGRGIETRFDGRVAYVRWVLDNLPHESYLGMQIDRIDNDGHYVADNLRLVDPGTNQRNKRSSAIAPFFGFEVNAFDLWHLLKFHFPDFGLSRSRVARLVGQRVPWFEIVERAPRSRCREKLELSRDVLARYGMSIHDRPGYFKTSEGLFVRMRLRPGRMIP